MPRLPKPAPCRACPGDLWQHAIAGTKQLTSAHTGFSIGEGHGTNGVLIVGEALGANEDADGLPFRPYAQAGSLLERAIRRCGYLRDQFRITNIVRCFPGDTVVAGTDLRAVYTRWYDGPTIVAHTTDGNLTGTPNHPVLTQRGWVAMNQLTEGDYLVRGTFDKRVPSGDPYIDCSPTEFAKAFETLEQLAIRKRVVGCDMDFHRDGMDTDVYIVPLDRLLSRGAQTAISQHHIELSLEPSDDTTCEFIGSRARLGTKVGLLARRSAAFCGSMRCGDGSLTLAQGHVVPPDFHGLSSPAKLHTTFDEDAMKPPLAHTQSICQGFETLPVFVAAVRIVKVERSRFLGHVYNLATDSEQYTANGFIVHNCRPPHDLLADTSYEFDVIQHCRPYLVDELRTMKPRCILALGGTAARELTGLSGKKAGITYIRGYVLPCIIPGFERIPVICSFHPSFLRQGKPQYFGVLCADMQRAVEVARTGVLAPLPVTYRMHPPLDDAWSFYNDARNNANLWLTYDIETPNSAEMDEDERDEDRSFELTQVQFSLRIGEGIAFPPTPEYLEVARKLLQLPNQKAGHNVWLFDDPRLVHNAIPIAGHAHDTMCMWKHQQPDLAANLQAVGSFEGMDRVWKHLAGSDLPFYGCCDVDAPQRILARLPEQLRKRGLWDGYERLVYNVRPILARMEQRGIPINDERRRAFGAELDKAAQETDAEMQRLVPEECRNVHPKQGYKREPKDTTGLVQRLFEVPGIQPEALLGQSANSSSVLRWCRIEPFKPSSQQLIRYMRAKGHPVPVNLKKGRETSEAKELERLARKTHDPLYRKVIWYREVRLMKATFVDGWAPKDDGRVHTTFTFAPATGQLSSRDPNVQNAPEHEKEGHPDVNLADQFQRIIEAPPGYKIVSFDHKSFHALTLAWLAQDRAYERVVRLDVHSFVASEFLKLKRIDAMMSYTDDELRDYLKWVKREHRFTRDFKCKRVILGWGFGRGYRSIYNAYMESFEGEGEAKRLVQTLEGCFPITVKWRKAITQKAHYDTYLVSAFKFIRWFWDVYHHDPKSGRLVNGDQAEQAIAFLPANTAFGMMREQAIEMQARRYDERYRLANNVHDSWKFVCPDALVDECLHNVKGLMEQPCATLRSPFAPDGLWCAVSASVGQNNGAKTADNPDGREEVDVSTKVTSTPVGAGAGCDAPRAALPA